MAQPINSSEINFDNGRSARVVLPGKTDSAAAILEALNLKDRKTVILILGGADNLSEEIRPKLKHWFGRGIARAATQMNAVIIDGGTNTGVMSLMGEGVADHFYQTPLIGVAPRQLVDDQSDGQEGDIEKKKKLEPNHSHFVLVEGASWSSKSPIMFDLFDELKKNEQPKNETQGNDVASGLNGKSSKSPGKDEKPAKLPTVAILAGGGQTTRMEVLCAVRKKITIIVLEGSGGLADEIVAAIKDEKLRDKDLDLKEILDDGCIRFHSLQNTAKGIEHLVISRLGSDKVLDLAWKTFADYDYNAGRHQNHFDKLQKAILLVGVIGTVLAVLTKYAPKEGEPKEIWWDIHHYVIVCIPILLTVLITAATRFKQGNKWLLLRAGAESIKREIYRYRARAMFYKEDLTFYLFQPKDNGTEKKVIRLSPEQQLAKRIEDITHRTMGTDVNLSAIKPYNNPNEFPPYIKEDQDDGFSNLSPERYVEVRLENQLKYYKKSSLREDVKLKRLYWLTFIIGGISTFLVVVNQEIWIAVTTSVVGAIATYLSYRQTENTLTKYNQAATDLSNVKSWWNALSADERASQINIDSLVEHTEQVLQSELDGWIQQMQNALAELRKGQEPTSEKDKNKGPGADAPDPNANGQARKQGTENADAPGKPTEAKDEKVSDPTKTPGEDVELDLDKENESGKEGGGKGT